MQNPSLLSKTKLQHLQVCMAIANSMYKQQARHTDITCEILISFLESQVGQKVVIELKDDCLITATLVMVNTFLEDEVTDIKGVLSGHQEEAENRINNSRRQPKVPGEYKKYWRSNWILKNRPCPICFSLYSSTDEWKLERMSNDLRT